MALGAASRRWLTLCVVLRVVARCKTEAVAVNATGSASAFVQCMKGILQKGVTEWQKGETAPYITVEWGYGNVSRCLMSLL